MYCIVGITVYHESFEVEIESFTVSFTCKPLQKTFVESHVLSLKGAIRCLRSRLSFL